MSAEEGDAGISAGRPTGTTNVCICSKIIGKTQIVDIWTGSGEDGESFSPEDLVSDPEEHEDEGSNLVDSRPSAVFQKPILLDLSRELLEAEVFDSYTYTGVIDF